MFYTTSQLFETQGCSSGTFLKVPLIQNNAAHLTYYFIIIITFSLPIQLQIAFARFLHCENSACLICFDQDGSTRQALFSGLKNFFN